MKRSTSQTTIVLHASINVLWTAKKNKYVINAFTKRGALLRIFNTWNSFKIFLFTKAYLPFLFVCTTQNVPHRWMMLYKSADWLVRKGLTILLPQRANWDKMARQRRWKGWIYSSLYITSVNNCCIVYYK